MSAASTSPQAALAREIAQYWDDPQGFALDCFEWEAGEGLDAWQAQFLADVGHTVRKRNFDGRTAVEPIRFSIASGHGVGKTRMMALIFWWIMSTRPEAKGRVTANTYSQLETTTWAEIQKLHRTLRCRDWFEVSGSKVYHKEHKTSWFAVPLTCAEENSEAFAGQHNRESTSFFLFDEASLIPDGVWDVAEAGLTDGEPMMFAFGNPTRNVGKFYEVCFGAAAHRWDTRSIDSRTCRFPNHDLHEEWIQDHGIDSDFCRVRIRGIAPSQSETQLIGRELVASAQQRQVVTLPEDPLVVGVDIPDGGSAWFVVRFRRGLNARPGPDVPAPVRIAGSKIDRETMVAKLAEILSIQSPARRVSAMFIDSGFGAAIVERLHALQFKHVFEISFGGKSPNPRFGNMRAFMWGYGLKEWLSKGAIDAQDKKLAADLVAPGFHYKVGGDGQLMVESKEDMRARGIASPDDGDALALCFARSVAPVPLKKALLPHQHRIPPRQYTPYA
jgi:hypothetical protein